MVLYVWLYCLIRIKYSVKTLCYIMFGFDLTKEDQLKIDMY